MILTIILLLFLSFCFIIFKTKTNNNNIKKSYIIKKMIIFNYLEKNGFIFSSPKKCIAIDINHTHCIECTICIEKFIENDSLIRLPCNHQYHYDCCKKWFLNNISCPICRSTFDIVY
jgi:hypothetical protein